MLCSAMLCYEMIYYTWGNLGPEPGEPPGLRHTYRPLKVESKNPSRPGLVKEKTPGCID